MRLSTALALSLVPLATGAAAGRAAPLSLSASGNPTAALSAPAFFPTTLTFPVTGTILGRVQPSDRLSVAFNRQVAQATLCSSWTNGTNNRMLTVAVQAVNATPSDYLTITSAPSATCAGGVFNFGTVSLGSTAYVSSTASYPSSTLALSQTSSSTTLTIALGSQSGGSVATVTSGSNALYTPSAAIRDLSGNSTGTSQSRALTGISF